MLGESRRLWHTTPKMVERKRYILPLAMLAPYIGTTALLGAGAGAATSGTGEWWNPGTWFGGGKGGDKGIGGFNYFTSPEYKKLADLLYGISEKGYPEIAQQGQQNYADYMSGAREIYETKRNPYGGGLADTPEFSQLAQGARGVASDVATQNINARMNALRMLTGITSPGVTTYEQPTDPLQELLSGGLQLGSSLAGSYLGSQWQGQNQIKTLQAMKDMGMFGGGGGRGGGLMGYDPYGGFFNNNYGNDMLSRLGNMGEGY